MGCKKINREGGGKGYDERKDVFGGGGVIEDIMTSNAVI
jgi:hypothetical protein